MCVHALTVLSCSVFHYLTLNSYSIRCATLSSSRTRLWSLSSCPLPLLLLLLLSLLPSLWSQTKPSFSSCCLCFHTLSPNHQIYTRLRITLLAVPFLSLSLFPSQSCCLGCVCAVGGSHNLFPATAPKSLAFNILNHILIYEWIEMYRYAARISSEVVSEAVKC